MNKTYLIVGGASMASLAVGAAGGYFVAKKRFDKQLDLGIAVETAKTKKYFSILLQEAKSGKPASPADIPIKEDPEEEVVEETPAQKEAAAKAGEALTNYQGFAPKPDLAEVVKNNIFADQNKKPLPPKDPATGRFVKSAAVPEDREPTPYIISEDEFLQNAPEHNQENLLYFKTADTLIQVMDREVIDNAWVGEVNLTLFPNVADGRSTICVRNEGLGVDYDIELTMESLTAYLGLGDEDEAVDMEAINAAVSDDEDEDPGAFAEDRVHHALSETRRGHTLRDL